MWQRGKTAQPEVKEPGLWDKIKSFFGMGGEEESQTQEEPYRLPTAEELLGKMCKSFGIYGQGKVDENAAKESGETVPTLNIGDMDPWTPGRWQACCMSSTTAAGQRLAAYTFAQDVDIDFITRVKELSLPAWRSRPPACVSTTPNTPPICWAPWAPSTPRSGPPTKKRAAIP